MVEECSTVAEWIATTVMLVAFFAFFAFMIWMTR